MVVGMSKYNFLVYYKEYNDFLLKLRDLGLCHVIERQSGIVEDGSNLQNQIALTSRFERVLKELAIIAGADDNIAKCKPAVEGFDYQAALDKYDSLQEEKTKIAQRKIFVQKEIERFGAWGEFDWDKIYSLRSAGYIVRFFTCAARNFNEEWVDNYNAIIVSEFNSQVYFITMTPEGVVTDMEETERVRLPKESLSDLTAILNNEIKHENEIENTITQFCFDSYHSLEQGYNFALEAVDLTKVQLSSDPQAENKLIFLEGWIPTKNTEEVNKYLDSLGIFYTCEKAKKEDPAPIKLHNNKFAALFHPIAELYQLPSYSELDLTPFFAPFFVMFFGLCLGDAGYGVILCLAGLIGRRFVKPAMKPMLSLVAVLGAGTIIFGFISGTFFGIELLKVKWPWIQNMKKFMLDPDKLFTLSLIVGAIQIIFGMAIKAVGYTIRFGFKNALSAWGWFIAIVGCGTGAVLHHFGIIDESVAKIIYYVAGGVGALGIFIFNDMKRNVFINVGAGVWDTYNMATGLMGDLLSYVRLFALGISGAVLGLVFNDLADKMSPDIPVIGFIVSLLILLFGHGMNIFMAGLGAFVHPMRLTFVEFYKNAGFEGGGKKYTPFARREKEDK